jgi:hypothetical protein
MRKDTNSALPGATGELGAVLIRAGGQRKDLGLISDASYHLIGRPIQWWRSLWAALRRKHIIPVTMGFAAFLAAYAVVDQPHQALNLFRDQRVVKIIMQGQRYGGQLGLVVTGGANFLATDMASGQASPRISSMNYHDSGTGTTAATSTDSGLQTQAGPTTRAAGTQSNPAANQYRSVGTISYTTSLAITEWGLFNQSAQGGTMWDHRVFSAINVNSGDSIQFTYTLTINAGGS